MFSIKFWLVHNKKTAPHRPNIFSHHHLYIHLTADSDNFYYNNGFEKMTNIKPGFSMDRLT